MEGALSVVLLPNLSISITPDEKLLRDALHFDTTLCKESFYYSPVLAMTRETESQLVTVFKSQGGSMARKKITHVGKRCFHLDGSRPCAQNVQDGVNKPGRERGSQLGIGPKPIGFSMIELRELLR